MGANLAEPGLAKEGDQFDVHGIIGVDVLQFLPEFKMVSCMNGSAWKVPGVLLPFGNILHFLHQSQVIPIEKYENSCTENDFDSVLEGLEGEVPAIMVNFVLHPNMSYFSPLDSLFPDSAVEHDLEQMFSLDSVGYIDEPNQSAQIDIELVSEFKKGIQFKDEKYHVNLPWKNDLTEQVPSNHKVALTVLNRVIENLEKRGYCLSTRRFSTLSVKRELLRELKLSRRILEITFGYLIAPSLMSTPTPLLRFDQCSTVHLKLAINLP